MDVVIRDYQRLEQRKHVKSFFFTFSKKVKKGQRYFLRSGNLILRVLEKTSPLL